MWIVRLALRFAPTFVVAALPVAAPGLISTYRTSADAFPNIDIPVVRAARQFSGMPADEIETRIVPVHDIEPIESRSPDGVGVSTARNIEVTWFVTKQPREVQQEEAHPCFGKCSRSVAFCSLSV